MTNETTPTPCVFLLLKEDGKVYTPKEPVPVKPEKPPVHGRYFSCRGDKCREKRAIYVKWKKHYLSELERLTAQAVVCEDQLKAQDLIMNATETGTWPHVRMYHLYEIKGYEVEFKKVCNAICGIACTEGDRCNNEEITATLRPVEDKKEKTADRWADVLDEFENHKYIVLPDELHSWLKATYEPPKRKQQQ